MKKILKVKKSLNAKAKELLNDKNKYESNKAFVDAIYKRLGLKRNKSNISTY